MYFQRLGLLKVTYEDDEGAAHHLTTTDQYEELGRVMSYTHYLQNQWGPETDGYFGYTTKTRDDFDMLLSNHPPSKLPIGLGIKLKLAARTARLGLTNTT